MRRLNSDKALDYWRRGVEAGKEALGEAFEELEGEFWGFLETRPYMRARIGLAYALWNRGAHDEAIEHLRAMLILNPNDNQGARYILAAWLVETERDDELAGLLSAYSEDDMAAWSYTTALAAFRREGDNENSRKLLSKALLSNEHVPGYLLGDRPMPKASPPYYSPGNRDEAVCYLTDFQEGWDKTPGALEWLRACIPAKKRLQQSRKAKRSA